MADSTIDEAKDLAKRLKNRARVKAWRLANPEKRRAQHAAWLARPENAAKEKARFDARKDKKAAYDKARLAAMPADAKQTILVRNRERYYRTRVLKRCDLTPEELAEKKERRRRNHALWNRVHSSKRRALKRNSVGQFTHRDVLEILAQQRCKCALCKVSLKSGYHVDHIMPLRLGGSNDRRNIQLLCGSCNCRKNAKHPLVFARECGFLL